MEYQLTQFIVSLRTPELTGIMLIFTSLGSWYISLLAFLISSVYFALKRKRAREIILIGLSLAINPALGLLFKELIQRSRPPIELALVQESTFSMPSNHALIASGFYGMLLWQFALGIKNQKLKIASLVLGSLIIILIGFSRIYLGVHWLSDVIIGFLLGIIVNGFLILSHAWTYVHLPHKYKV